MGKERVAHQKNLGVDSICSRALSDPHRQHGFSFLGLLLQPSGHQCNGRRLIKKATMQTSDTNVLKGKVSRFVEGAVNYEITLEIAPGVEIVGITTKASAALLGLAEGETAFAVVRITDVRFGGERRCFLGNRPKDGVKSP